MSKKILENNFRLYMFKKTIFFLQKRRSSHIGRWHIWLVDNPVDSAFGCPSSLEKGRSLARGIPKTCRNAAKIHRRQ